LKQTTLTRRRKDGSPLPAHWTCIGRWSRRERFRIDLWENWLHS